MKQISYLYMLLAAVMFAACVDNTWVEHRPEVDADHLLITFRTSMPEMQEVATRNADPDGLGIQKLSLLCFDEMGNFISRVSPKTTVDPGMLSGTFQAVVPQYTKIIHFVANQNFDSFNEPGSVGRHENTILPGLISSSSMLVYWGRISCPGDQSLDEYIQANYTGDNKAVPLYRNQAMITVNAGTSGYVVTGFATCNQYAFGTVAPFNVEEKNFEWDNSSQYVSLPVDKTKATDPDEVMDMAAEFVFENENMSGDEVYVIFRAKSPNSTNEELYYRVSLLDPTTLEPMPILRNHHYRINILGILDNGVATFEEAVKAPPVNNIWIAIDESIPTVSDGQHVLGVDETFVVYDVHPTAPGFQTTLGYTYTNANGSAVSDAEKPEITWLDNQAAAPGIGNTYDTNNGKGKIAIELLALGGETRREATLLVKKGKLQRTIKIIVMQTMEFVPAWVSTQVSNVNYGEGVTLMFNIPEETPEELFPMTVRIGANQLNPDILLNKLDVINRTSASPEEWGEKIEIDGEEIGFKYIYLAQGPGVQRVYFKTDLAGSEQSQISVEADHFETVVKFYTFSDKTATINVANAREYTMGNSQVKFLLVPPKINYRVDMEYELSEATRQDNAFMFYSSFLDHYTDDELDGLGLLNQKECAFLPISEDKWATGGRVFLFKPVVQGNTTYRAFMKTNSPNSSEVVRISTYPREDNYDYVDYKSTTFELTCYNPFEFNVTANGNKGEVSLPYGPDEEVALSFDVKQVTRVDQLGQSNTIDPFGTAFDVYIDAPRLTFDRSHPDNQPYLNKVTIAADGRLVYHVDADMDEENKFGTDGCKTLIFKTARSVSAEEVRITAQKDVVSFTPGVVTLTNHPMMGTIVYRETADGPETPVPAGSFVTFERADGTRIGTMTITEDGQYSVKLKPEYRYDWATVKISVYYRKMDGGTTTFYHAITTLPTLVEGPVKLVLDKVTSSSGGA